MPQDSPNTAVSNSVWQKDNKKRQKRDKLVPYEDGKNGPVQEEHNQPGTWTQHEKLEEKDFVICFREAQTKTVTLKPEPNKTSTLTRFQ